MPPVRFPGTYSEGGIDSLLAPRTTNQQANFSNSLADMTGGLPRGTHNKVATLAKIPVAGQLIAQVVMQRAKDAAETRAKALRSAHLR
jgi:hypothetical protein